MKTSHTRQYLAAIISSFSNFCAGASFVWTTPLLPKLQEAGAEVFLTHTEASWVVSLTELGNIFSAIPAAFLCDKLGRKPVLLSAAPMYIGTWILVLLTRNVMCLYIMRFIQGLAIGVVYTVLPLYLGEIGETALRGTLTTFFTFMFFSGVMSVYCIGPYLSYQNLTGYCLATSLVYLAAFWFIPESPYFYLMKGKKAKCASALMWLRGTSEVSEVQDEMEIIQDLVNEESKSRASWKDVVQTRAGRKSLLIVNVVITAQVLGGFTVILSFTTDTFTKSGEALMDPDIYTMIVGVVTMAVTIFSGILVDRAGRKPILMISSIGGFVTLLLTAIYYFFRENHLVDISDWLWVPYVTIIAYMIIINFGVTALHPTLQAELFPNSTRGIASGISGIVFCALSFVILIIYIPIQDAVGLYLNYTIFAGSTLVCAILIFILLPETKGKTFQEIQTLL